MIEYKVIWNTLVTQVGAERRKESEKCSTLTTESRWLCVHRLHEIMLNETTQTRQPIRNSYIIFTKSKTSLTVIHCY